ncbi:MAG: hypothetical protein AAF639_45405 [Chloroflexota bacterium]
MSMNKQLHASWHQASYNTFMQERLPALLAERLPLASYRVESTGEYTCQVVVALDATANNVEVSYADVPQPDETGIFVVNGGHWTVVPVAENPDERLDTAEIVCVGEMLYAFFDEKLGHASTDLPWDEELLRAWLPLDSWISDKFGGPARDFQYDRYFQFLDRPNWQAAFSHTRRLWVTNRKINFTQEQIGRVCPFEMPEGPNMGRIFSIAVGAEIRDGRLIIADDRPEATLGLSATMIPCIEHDNPMHVLMGANMMRQWLPYGDGSEEPALVQTGLEPPVEGIWCGRNLLTAYMPWGVDTFESGIVLSATGAKVLGDPSDRPIEPGDKLSNRHGTKGVVSRILPDDEMPRLADGTPIHIIFNSISQHVRINFGQIREAVIGRIAHAKGEPRIVPAFNAPDMVTLQAELRRLGLREDGMEMLVDGRTGEEFDNPITIGWVYWGRLVHRAQDKLLIAADEASAANAQRQGHFEHQILQQVGATALLREHYQLRAWIRGGGTLNTLSDAAGLAERIANGAKNDDLYTGNPTLLYSVLQKRLAAAGIHMGYESGYGYGNVRFSLERADGLKLVKPVRHPWLHEQTLSYVGTFPALDERPSIAYVPMWSWPSPPIEENTVLPEYTAVAHANDKLARLLNDNAPSSLVETAHAQLEQSVRTYFDTLLQAGDVHFDNRLLFSVRAVLTPGVGIGCDQVGLSEEIAWSLFGPLVMRELGDQEAVKKRTAEATQTLDTIMARSWVILNRQPTSLTTMLAFRPVRTTSGSIPSSIPSSIPDTTVRLHPMACRLLDADFDGDQIAVLLPITEAGQREAEELLSIKGHLMRDHSLIQLLAPRQEAMLGLAMLTRKQAGRTEMERKFLLGPKMEYSESFVTRGDVINALTGVMNQHPENGPHNALVTAARLWAMGFEAVSKLGVSVPPFAEGILPDVTPPDEAKPTDEALDVWLSHADQLTERLASSRDYDGPLGAQLMTVKSGARGEMGSLAQMIGVQGVINDGDGQPLIVRRGFSEGLTPPELFALVNSAQARVNQYVQSWTNAGAEFNAGIGGTSLLQPHTRSDDSAPSYHVFARARRAAQPGVVFARAAVMGEADWLDDEDTRLFVGVSS